MKFKYFTALAWIGLVSLSASSSSAQTTEERAGARAAADQGYDEFKAGRWATAIDLFTRAESLVHSPVHVLFLARSQAKLGRLLEAKEAYLQVLREPSAAPAAGVKQARVDAERELAELEPQIPLVSVQIEGAVPAEVIEVTQDGLPLSSALIGVARPLNPGQHAWRAWSDSRPPVTVQRSIEPGTESQVNLRLAPQREVELVTASPRPPSEPQQDTAPAAGSGGPSGWVYAGLGVTAVGVGVGIGFLLHKNDLEEQILETCTPNCSATPDNVQRKEDADRAGMISAIGFVGAGLGLTGAIVIWLLEPNGKTPAGSAAATADWQPWIGLRSAGVSGRF